VITADDLAFLIQKPDETVSFLPSRLLDMALPEAVETIERTLIRNALTLAGNNRADAARRLGISRQTLYTKLASLGIE
jgi:DNA-binding NtrC family response regulator